MTELPRQNKRVPSWRWFKLALLAVVPILLSLVWAEQMSWHPKAIAFKAELHDLQYSPDGRWLAALIQRANSPSEVVLWDAKTRQETHRLESDGSTRELAFSPDGRWLATQRIRQLKVWSLSSFKSRETRDHDLGNGLTFSSDSKFILSCTDLPDFSGAVDNYVLFHDIKAWKLRRSVTLRHSDFIGAAVSSDGRFVAGKWDPKYVNVWRVDTAKSAYRFPGSTEDAVEFSPNGKFLAVGGYDGTIRLWNMSTGQQLSIVRAFRRPVETLGFSADGRSLAAAGESVKIWNLADGKIMRSIPVRAKRLSVAPTGEMLATCNPGVPGPAPSEIQIQLWRVK